jgi:putative membrane protein
MTRSVPRTRVSPWKGLLAGAVGGLVASFAMSQFSSLFISRSNSEPGQEDSTVRAASAISQTLFRHELTPDQKAVAGPVTHYLFGATMAATYGVVAEFWDAARLGGGLPFGAAVWLAAHVITVPALGLSEPITHNAPADEVVEGAAHLVYGAVAEGVRRSLRKILASRTGA